MTLRARLIASNVCVLLASLVCGSAVMAWHAAGSVRTELQAALDGGTRTARGEVDRSPVAGDPLAALRHLITTFDGNRHVQAALLDKSGASVAMSALYRPARPAPAWFRRMIGPDLPQRHILTATHDTIVLQADSRNEVSEVWNAAVDALTVLGGFALAATLLICAVVGRALRPLEQIVTAFGRVGGGDYSLRVATRGPGEVTQLATGFNTMSEQLAAMAAQNIRLNERLLTLQAEERAELARDLHDDVGPLLFAVDMTAATIERLTDGRQADIPPLARSIQDAVSHAQAHVRALLGRLRPIHAAGLETAIERLAAFWRRHRRDITITVRVDDDVDAMGDDLKETVYRIVQEGLSNAIRHGQPSQVDVVIGLDNPRDLQVEVRDNGGGLRDTADGGLNARLGLIGMRERVMALTGSVSLTPVPDGQGLALIVRLPLQREVESA